MRRFAAGAALVGLLLLPEAAHAVERGQEFGVDAGLAMLSISDGLGTQLGISYGVHYTLRLTDQFDFLSEVGGAITDLDPIVTPGGPTDRPSRLWNADVGIAYRIDVTRFVPYFGALAGGYILNGGSLAPSVLAAPGVEIAAGADFLINRRLSVGIAAREHFLLTQLDTYPSYLTVAARFQVTWGGM